MATFKKTKKFVAGGAKAAMPAESDDYDLGLSDLSGSDDDGSDAGGSQSGGSDDEQGDEEGSGISFLEYLSLQKSLRRVTEQKIQLNDDNRELSDKLRKSDYELKRAGDTNRRQIAILNKAQKNQMIQHSSIIDSLKLVVEEMEEAAKGGDTEKTEGIRQLVDTMKRISDERRELEIQAAELQGTVEQMEQDKLEIISVNAENQATMKAELKELRSSLNPVKLDAIITAAEASVKGGVSHAEMAVLQAELKMVKDKLEITEAQKDALQEEVNSPRGLSAEQQEKMDAELKERVDEIESLQAELNETRAELAKVQAASESGSGAAAEAKSLAQELNNQITELTKQSREQVLKIEDMESKLKNEMAAHKRSQDELAEIRANMDSKAAAGADNVQQVQDELAAVTASLNSEKGAHAATSEELAATKEQLLALREETAGTSTEFEEKLRQEKERSVTVLQNLKADHAADLAEAKQRAMDDVKDLKKKMEKLGTVVLPMVKTMRAISTDFKTLRNDTKELQSTIAPASKQCKRDLLKVLAEVDKQYKEMLTKYRKEMALRKKLHNELVDLKGNIRVFTRIRPIISEDGKGPDASIAILPDPRDDQLLLCSNKGKKSTYEFDVVFGPKSSQQEVYDRANDLIISVLDGYNVCIFAYGQTGSGKTWTMEGNTEHPGLNKRALKALFALAAEKSVDWSYEFEVSVMEIYCENLKDLLTGKKKDNKLDIRQGKKGPFVPGLTKKSVKSQEEVDNWFNEAKKVRATATTDMNEHSSRSHCLLVVYVTGTNLSTGVQTNGKLNLIDLAGSERVGKSGAIDDEKRLKEATAINKSLSSLGDVISALGSKQKHIPFRNSKLTYLLQDSLGGAAKTLMVCQISPVVKNAPESVCSLNFADRVKKVELGSAKKQSESAEMASLRKRIKELEGH